MPGNPFTDPNWAPELANTVDRVVTSVRKNATDKAVLVVRGIVFGVVILIAGFAALVLGIILGTRLLQVVASRIFRTDHDTTVWVAYILMGVIMLILGWVAMRLRVAKGEPS
jgi:uncharacterized membrane protein YidH (DUF202 family)